MKDKRYTKAKTYTFVIPYPTRNNVALHCVELGGAVIGRHARHATEIFRQNYARGTYSGNSENPLGRKYLNDWRANHPGQEARLVHEYHGNGMEIRVLDLRIGSFSDGGTDSRRRDVALM